eukprot:312555-Pelagomonas_calceolata.AAC.1
MSAQPCSGWAHRVRSIGALSAGRGRTERAGRAHRMSNTYHALLRVSVRGTQREHTECSVWAHRVIRVLQSAQG